MKRDGVLPLSFDRTPPQSFRPTPIVHRADNGHVSCYVRSLAIRLILCHIRATGPCATRPTAAPRGRAVPRPSEIWYEPARARRSKAEANRWLVRVGMQVLTTAPSPHRWLVGRRAMRCLFMAISVPGPVCVWGHVRQSCVEFALRLCVLRLCAHARACALAAS